MTRAAARMYFLAIALLAAAPVLLLRPFQNTPYVDDWTYAWSVEHLLQTGELRILDWSTSLHLAQTLWGALFCLPFGFSFSALRVSTWILSVAGLWGFYKLLIELGISRRDALISTLLLEACPIYFMLSFTFMTDVPWLAVTNWFAFCFVRAVRTCSDRWLVGAALLAVVAGAFRLTGIILPLVMLATLVLHGGAWGRNPARLLAPIGALAALLVMTYNREAYTTHLANLALIKSSAQNRMINIKYGVLALPSQAPQGLLCAAGTVGLLLAPWFAGLAQKALLRRTAIVCGLLLALLAVTLVAGGTYHAALVPGAIWSLHELGFAEPFVNNYQEPEMPAWSQWVLGAISFPAFSFALAQAVRRPGSPGDASLQWLLLAEFLLICVLWFFYDRYLLVMLPFLAALTLKRTGFIRPWACLAVGALFYVLCMAGLRDHLAYSRAASSGVEFLQRAGVKNSDIDGGYVYNGWLQYAHPEDARRDRNGFILVPSVNVRLKLPYQISNQPVEGWRLLARAGYSRWLSRSGTIYVLRREEAAK
jgi:hypothetical protein